LSDDDTLTNEHFIPQQIGGRLYARFLCKHCNERLGHEVESTVKRDPSIRLAVEHLRPILPDLASEILDGQPYIGHGQGGVVRGRYKDGAFRVDSNQGQDGSIVQPIPDGRKHIERVLRKQGSPDDAVVAALEQFDSAPDNQLVTLADGLAAIRRRVENVTPALGGPFLPDQVLLKIAYEFAACHMADKAQDSSPQLAALRSAVWLPARAAGVFSIEHLTTRRYAPVHHLSLAGQTPHAVVTICLFGWLLFRVHLRQVAIPPPHFRYTHCLATGDEDCEQVEEKGHRSG
jgi:hypothetical protein